MPDVPTLEALGDAEGSVDIVAWSGFVEPAWSDTFTEDTGCVVNRKVAGTSDEMVQLMRTGDYDLVSASGDASLRLIVGGDVAQLRSQERRRERDVDESGAGHLEVTGDTVEHPGVDDPLRYLARVGSDLLGERERAVDLRIGTIGRSHGRIGRSAAVQLGEDRLQQVRDRGDGVRHGRASLPDADGRLTERSTITGDFRLCWLCARSVTMANGDFYRLGI